MEGKRPGLPGAPPQAKRLRGAQAPAPSQFEAELAQLEELEAELAAERAAEEPPPPPESEGQPLGGWGGAEAWMRGGLVGLGRVWGGLWAGGRLGRGLGGRTRGAEGGLGGAVAQAGLCPPPAGSLFVGEVNPKWRRPAPPPQPPTPLCFFQLEIDHYIGQSPRDPPLWGHPLRGDPPP